MQINLNISWESVSTVYRSCHWLNVVLLKKATVGDVLIAKRLSVIINEMLDVVM